MLLIARNQPACLVGQLSNRRLSCDQLNRLLQQVVFRLFRGRSGNRVAVLINNLAKKSNVDPRQWFNMVTQTIFNAPIYINYGNILLKEAFQPAGFSLRLGLKDVNLVMEQATETNAAMPLGNLLQQRLHECVGNGLGEYDLTAVALALK